jgi:hypothetical protein
MRNSHMALGSSSLLPFWDTASSGHKASTTRQTRAAIDIRASQFVVQRWCSFRACQVEPPSRRRTKGGRYRGSIDGATLLRHSCRCSERKSCSSSSSSSSERAPGFKVATESHVKHCFPKRNAILRSAWQAQVDKLLLMVVHADVQETSLVGVATVLAIVPGCCTNSIDRISSSWTRQWCIDGADETSNAFVLIVVDAMRLMKKKDADQIMTTLCYCWTGLPTQATLTVSEKYASEIDDRGKACWRPAPSSRGYRTPSSRRDLT